MDSRQYAQLANDAYEARRQKEEVVFDGRVYQVVAHADRRSGYQGTIYEDVQTHRLIVAHRGTAGALDGLVDLRMVASRVNTQAEDAIAFTRQALELARARGLGRDAVTVTGHSLGGALSQVTAHHFALRGETFNAYGAVSLDRRIPEGGTSVVNHVMAADPVSAGARHFGQVRIYATERDIQALGGAGYGNRQGGLDLRRPPIALGFGLGAHSMHHFTDRDARGTPDRPVLDDPVARQRARAFEPMIERYRSDVGLARGALTLGMGGPLGLARAALDEVRGPVEAGAPDRPAAARPGPPPAPGPMRALPGERRCDGEGGALFPLPGYVPGSSPIPCAPRVPSASVERDPRGHVEAMLAAAGDPARFRELTREAAAAPAGRALQEEAAALADARERAHAAQRSPEPIHEHAPRALRLA